MKKTITNVTRVLAIVLSVLTIMSVMPMQTFATGYRNYQTLTHFDIEPDADLDIKNEVIEKRSANSKTYLLEDGTYCSLTTSEPIHTYKDGEWVDFESNLTEPDTIDDAISQLSFVQAASLNVGSDDGFINTAKDQSINIWGIDDENNVTVDSVSLDESTIGIVKCNIINNDLNTLYNKTEVTIKANLRLTCTHTEDTNTIAISSINSHWDPNSFVLDDILGDPDDEDFVEQQTLDYNSIDSSGRYVWDITSEYIKWESGVKSNNGVMLSTDNEVATINSGVLQRQYRVIDDNDLGFTYHDIDMGRAGTLYINDYTNVPYLVRDELSLDGNIMPVSITRFINTGVDNNSFGAGGRWNYESKLSKTADTYIWDMFNGSSARFQRAIPIEKDSDGCEKWVEYQYNAQGYTLWVDTAKSRYGDYSNNRIVDDFGNIYKFTNINDECFVESVISGANENDILRIEYFGGKITSITDGVGRKYSFTYDGPIAKKIGAYMTGESDEQIQIVAEGSCGKGTPVEITFEYEIINNDERLTKATYADGKSVGYAYDSIGRLTGIKNIDGSLLELTYAVSVSNAELNAYPIYAHRISEYTKKCLDENGEYVTEYTVKINADNSYHRFFEQTNSQDVVVFSETLQFNRNLDLLYMTNSAGDSFYADYDDSHNMLSLVIPDSIESNVLDNSTMEKRAGNNNYPKVWEKPKTLPGDNFFSRKRDGNNTYVVFNNSFSNLILLTQEQEVEAKTGEKYVISAWGIGEATLPREDHFWGIRVLATNADGELVTIHQMAFDASLWNTEQIRSTAFAIPFNTSSITVQMVSDKQLGKVGFDDVYLCKAENAYVAEVDDVQDNSKCKCSDCETYNCMCPCDDEEKCSCVSCKIKDISSKDEHGNITKDGVTNGLSSIISQNEYNENSNYLSRYTDENGVSTSYEYSLENGLKKSEKLKNGSSIIYGYDAIGALTSVSQTVTNIFNNDFVPMRTEYAYENDRISSITHNGFSYNYEYNIFGDLSSISVSNIPLVSYTYKDDYYKNIDTITYANGMTITYAYDAKNNITGISYDGGSTWTFSYEYDAFGQLISFTDTINNTITSYNKTIDGVKYDEVVETLGEESTIVYGYVENAKVPDTQSNDDSDVHSDDPIVNISRASYTQSFFGKNYSIENSTNYRPKTGTKEDVQATSISMLNLDGGVKVATLEDSLGRRAEEVIEYYLKDENNQNSENVYVTFKNEYTYKPISDTQESRLVETYTTTITVNGTPDDYYNGIVKQIKYIYDYDEAGRIAKVFRYFDEDYYMPLYFYSYDEAGQLVFEANVAMGEIWTYTYDAGGNITSKNLYDAIEYNEETWELDISSLGEPVKTISYGYDEVWKDKLTSFDDVSIEYDALGNPLNYHGYPIDDVDIDLNLEWNGRLLSVATSEDGSLRYEYRYNDSGLRTGKTIYFKVSYNVVKQDETGSDITVTEEQYVPMAIFDYIWSNDILIGYKTTINYIVQDEDGKYTLDNYGHIITQEMASIIAKMIYNKNNEIIGVNCTIESNGESISETFYYAKDAQGNVTSIYSVVNNYNFDFYYDSFGRMTLDLNSESLEQLQKTINNASGFLEGAAAGAAAVFLVIAIIGVTVACAPNAYRGYVFDYETGLYYCQSRYYSPSWGRFINADDTTVLEMTTGDVHGANLFAYCNNDPVNFIDPTGFYYISLNNLAKIILCVVGINPIGATLLAIGIAKLKAYFVAKMAALGLRLGKFWGPAVCGIITVAFGLTGLAVGGPIAQALWDCVMQGKKGIEFTVKKNKWGYPYRLDIYAK